MSLNSWVGIHIWFVWSLNIFIWPPLQLAIPYRWRENNNHHHLFHAITKKTLFHMRWNGNDSTFPATPLKPGHKWPKMAWIKLLLMWWWDFFPPCWFRDLIFDGVETRDSRYFYFLSISSYSSFIFMNQLMGHLVGLKSR